MERALDVTTSTASDLVRYYDKLLSGSGGLPPEQADVILDNIARFTPTGLDGYPQRFGIPPTGFFSPNRSRSSRAGSAAGTAATSCMCRPA